MFINTASNYQHKHDYVELIRLLNVCIIQAIIKKYNIRDVKKQLDILR